MSSVVLAWECLNRLTTVCTSIDALAYGYQSNSCDRSRRSQKGLVHAQTECFPGGIYIFWEIRSKNHTNDVKYTLYDDSTTSIPIFAAKEDASSQTLTEVATLHISVNSGLATFLFTPANVAISLITIGSAGTFTTYFNGISYGYNDYLLPVGCGSASAADTGTGSLSGTYKVIGYEPASVL